MSPPEKDSGGSECMVAASSSSETNQTSLPNGRIDGGSETTTMTNQERVRSNDDDDNNNSSSIPNVSLLEIIQSHDETIRHISLAEWCKQHGGDNNPQILLEQADVLHRFVTAADAADISSPDSTTDKANTTTNNNSLYEKVRALFFLYAIHRFHLHALPPTSGDDGPSGIPYEGYKLLLERKFDEATRVFLKVFQASPSRALSSALAKSYYLVGFQTLANQVRISVQHHRGNAWMFQVTQPRDHPKRVHPKLLESSSSAVVILREQTPVRMDLSHCGWSDIFFLGMDFPEGARVLNVSVDLAVHGRHTHTSPPIASYLEIISHTNDDNNNDADVYLKLTSIDLNTSVTLTHVSQVFDFCQDYLGLLRAGIIASGIVPPGLEHSRATLAEVFATVLGPGKSLHLTTKVNDIPKGSRLAVSTNLLGSIISLCMRATQQTAHLTGELSEEERRLVAARAILGEWLGGSGGGWQDSGGVWPGIKLIEGVRPSHGDPEHGKSRGRLLPLHRQLSDVEAPPTLIDTLQKSLVLVHGGMAQNVGPVLEMVSEKYLLRESKEWEARQEALTILDDILETFKNEDITTLARLTTHNFFKPIQTIIPWASNLYTETLIERTRARFGEDFLGFWMLGGCSGGGMGFIFKPEVKAEALNVMQAIMLQTKREMESAIPFAMDPVVYDFSVNDRGTVAEFCEAVPTPTSASIAKKPKNEKMSIRNDLEQVLQEYGFDKGSHEAVQKAYKTGKIGLRHNRLPLETEITDAKSGDVIFADRAVSTEALARGRQELEQGTVAVVSLAAGIGSRWTQGAGCVKALHPFCKLRGKHRSFVEVHLAKSRSISNKIGIAVPHVITTSHMTHAPLESYLKRVKNHGYEGPLYLSHGKSIGLRMVPTVDDLRFLYEEKQQQKLDEQAQKVKESGYNALIGWAKSVGEASDYRDNLPMQCLHPVGHYYEIPNLILNGTLKKMLEDRPQLKYLMLHNIDTVGADVDPGLLGLFALSTSTLSFEVIPREIEDIGGGLARVDGKTRIIEGLALPRDEDEFIFSYYNSMTTWIDIDKLLLRFRLTKDDLSNESKVADALNTFAQRLPTYVALKEVKKRWGNGQEDVFPTAQFEKLWSDLSSTLDAGDCDFVVVPRVRGAQLKEQAQLDGWLRDGSATYLESICCFDHEPVEDTHR